MIFGKKNRKYIENNMAEMLALVGGAMEYCNTHDDDLEGYEEYYENNRKKDGFHYRMQKYADKTIRNELKDKGVHCKRRVSKRFYRCFQRGSKKISIELYDYFKWIMDYILGEKILLKITLNEILKDCGCEVDVNMGSCLTTILDWQYKRLVKYNTNIAIVDLKRKEKAQILLNKLKRYSQFGRFQTECQIAHGVLV